VSEDRRAQRRSSHFNTESVKKRITNWEADNENIITVNIKLLRIKITVLRVYATSNDKLDLENISFMKN